MALRGSLEAHFCEFYDEGSLFLTLTPHFPFPFYQLNVNNFEGYKTSVTILGLKSQIVTYSMTMKEENTPFTIIPPFITSALQVAATVLRRSFGGTRSHLRPWHQF